MKKLGFLGFSILALSIASTGWADTSITPEAEPEAPIVAPKAMLETPDPGITLQTANNETLASAVGHYARSRALLIEAIREFDRGSKLARPDALLDGDEWRDSLVSRAEDLERVLAPRPRVTKGGIRFDAAPQLLNATREDN